MAYCGYKKKEIEDPTMGSLWEAARPEEPWNPWGQLPPRQRGGGGDEEESCAPNNLTCRFPYLANFSPPIPLVISKKFNVSTKTCISYV